MLDPTILSAKIAVLEDFFKDAGFSMPPAYRAILGHPERLPGRSDLFFDVSRVIAKNHDLRKSGWFDSDTWPKVFLAIGTDPGGNVIYFDASQTEDTVWLADHELSFVDADVSQCVGMQKLADSFPTYIAREWQKYLEQEGQFPTDSQDRSEEFNILREHPDPHILENYFIESAVRYEAYQSWKHRKGDYLLFFAVINLKPEVAFQLLVPAAKIAGRQQTYGRLRAAVCLLSRLLGASKQAALPQKGAVYADEILKRADLLNLDDYEAWDSVKSALKVTKKITEAKQ